MPSFVFENRLLRQGFKLIAGVDEAGRGPLAGPIVAAAIILPSTCFLPGLDDSKKLSPKQRDRLFLEIKRQAIAIGLAAVSHRQIDKINIGRANLLVMERAVLKLKIKPEYLLLDGGRYRVALPLPQRGIDGGDGRSVSIAAASVIAKVTRDRLMAKYHACYPDYGFDRHKGYGTPDHLLALARYGPCPIHRRSFFPLSALP